MRSILITGTSSGIGQATAQLFARKGWKVIATMRRPKPIEGCQVEPLDVTDKKQVQKLADKIGPVDVLVNNAGYGAFGVFESLTDEQIRNMYEVNFFGLLNVTRAFLPAMRKKNTGVIVNVSSIVGRVIFPFGGIYGSSKHAVEGFSEGLGHDLSHTNIRVKMVEPGLIATDFRSDWGKNIAGYPKHPEYDFSEGSAPSVIAQLIYRAATDGSSRLRYSGGKFAKMVLGMRSVLPDWLYVKFIRFAHKNSVSK